MQQLLRKRRIRFNQTVKRSRVLTQNISSQTSRHLVLGSDAKGPKQVQLFAVAQIEAHLRAALSGTPPSSAGSIEPGSGR
jgi:hypothetical protein